jgi:hypothetical protein
MEAEQQNVQLKLKERKKINKTTICIGMLLFYISCDYF